MIKLEAFFKVHFKTKKISDDNLREFSQEHLSGLTIGNPGGIYDGLIAETTTLYEIFRNAISDEGTLIARREGATVGKNKAMKNFQKNLSQKEGLVRSAFGKKSAEYQEFFPHNVKEYLHANMGTIDIIMVRFLKACIKYQPELGVEFVNLFTQLKDDFVNARESQMELKGKISGAKAASRNSRREMEKQLMKNLLIIASNNVGEPNKVSLYFNQRLLKYRKHKQNNTI